MGRETKRQGGKTYVTPLSTMPLISRASPSRKSSKPPPNLLDWRQWGTMPGKGADTHAISPRKSNLG